MWDPVPQSGIKPGLSALGAQSLSHRTAREAPLWTSEGRQTEAVEAARIFLKFPDRNQNVFIHEEKLLLESIIVR